VDFFGSGIGTIGKSVVGSRVENRAE